MKSKESSDLEILKRISLALIKKYEQNISDIALFGSAAKGKASPSDIDLAVLTAGFSEEDIIALTPVFQKNYGAEVHLNFLRLEKALSNPLYKTILIEGISLIHNKPIYEELGFESGSIFSFKLTKLEKSKKVLFYYALHGKKGKQGLLHNSKATLLSNTVLFVPLDAVSLFQQFLEQWHVDFQRRDVLKS